MDEPEAEQVNRIRGEAALPFIALTELYYSLWRKKGEEETERIYGLVLGWNLPLFWPDQRIVREAARLKAQYRFSLADSYIAAFAIVHGLTLVVKDPDFDVLAPELKLLQLVARRLPR